MSARRVGRQCSRAGCSGKATMTLTYVYAESIAVVGPLATYSEPHAYDLCNAHGSKLTVPNGWQVIKRELDNQVSGPSDEDLMAIADAVREVGNKTEQSKSAAQSSIGRRGHLRSVPK